MGFRRSPRQREATHGWTAFVAANVARFRAAGLPPLASRSVIHWDDLLLHGRFNHHEDPSHFNIASLTGEQYTVFADLVESYFLAGYEYFIPTALREGDRDRLGRRFSGERG
jgi:hypothetical protein